MFANVVLWGGVSSDRVTSLVPARRRTKRLPYTQTTICSFKAAVNKTLKDPDQSALQHQADVSHSLGPIGDTLAQVTRWLLRL